VIRVGVVGATGYVGGEVVRWMLVHPAFELSAVVSRSHTGEPLSSVLPGLLGLTDLVLETFDAVRLARLDVVVLATPHGAAAPLAAELERRGVPVILDCSRDHRHAAGWVYGQPEWSREALVGATRIAAPGCFATAIALALAPFVHAGVVTGPVNVAAATGSTGSGAAPSAATHHPERFANLKAYKVLTHQHVPEILAFLGGLGTAPELAFVPLSAPVDRGIFATCFIPCAAGIDARALVADAYAGHRLVRLREGSPELRLVRGTGFCDLAVHRQGDTVVVLSAIDNLGRGAAAQAIQALEVAMAIPGPSPIALTPPVVP
jgi:N-acetyl-gamma-glutamyl-phosphate reductase